MGKFDELFRSVDKLKEKLGRLPTCKELDEFTESNKC